MSFNKVHNTESKDGVTLLQNAIFLTKGKPLIPHESALRIGLSCILEENRSDYVFKDYRTYKTAISDLEFEITELSPDQHGITRIKLAQEKVTSSIGKERLDKLFGILKEVADYFTVIISSIPDPLFKILASSIWKLVGDYSKRPTKLESEGRLVVRHYKPWSFQAWHVKPVSIAQAYDLSFRPGLGSNYTTELQGEISYRIKVTGATGSVRFWRVDTVDKVTSELIVTTRWE